MINNMDCLKMYLYKKEQLQNILDSISKINKPNFIIAIDGFGGAGKSTLAIEIKEHLKNLFIVHMDDFYKQSELRNQLSSKLEIGGYFDWQRFEKQILIPFKEKKEIKFQKYDWQNDELKDWELIPASSNLIVEGVYSTRKELSKYYNLKIWIDCSPEIRLLRGIERDGEKIKEYWQNVWMVQETKYYEKHKPNLLADIIINNDI